MYKTKKQDFHLFKKHCLFWIDKLRITGWNIYFKWEKLEGNMVAKTSFRLSEKTAIISFGKKFDVGDENIEETIERFAKHEIIHFLTIRLADLAERRQVRFEEIDEADEELVNELCNLIK